MGLHHKLCHSLGGTLNLPHAQTHTVALPYVAASNLATANHAKVRLQDVLGVHDPAAQLQDAARALGAPTSLAELGMTEADIERSTRLVMAKPYANPSDVTKDDVPHIIRAAWKEFPVADIAAVPAT